MTPRSVSDNIQIMSNYRGPRRALSVEQEQEAIRRCSTGESARRVAFEFGVDPMTIGNTLRRHGVATHPARTKHVLTEEQRGLVVEACRNGSNVRDAATAFGVSEPTVTRILRGYRAGGGVVDLATGRSRCRSINDAAFDVLTPEACYWIGFLFADGCLHHGSDGAPSVSVALKESDREHVNALRSFLGSTHAIGINRPGRQTFGGASACFRVRSSRLAAALAGYGMVPVKAERIPCHELSVSRHFWRGAVDGDGWLGTQEIDGILYAFVGLSGQRHVIERFCAFVAGLGVNLSATPTESGVFRAQASGKSAEKIIGALYRDASVALDRKLARARSIMDGDLVRFAAYTEKPSTVPIDDASPEPHSTAEDDIVRSLLREPFPYPEMLAAEEMGREVARLRALRVRLAGGMIVPRSRAGTCLCAPFFPGRYRATRGQSISAVDAWSSEAAMRAAVRFQVNHGDPCVPHRVLRAVTLRCRTPTIFKPSVARFVYERYGKKGGVAWDPCAGYGGRLLGAHAAGIRYIGTDVDAATIDGNRRLAKAISADATMVCCPAEDFDPGRVDLVFTSPPYFDREHYSEADGQSWRKHGASLDAWMDGFMRPVVERSAKVLDAGSCLVLNVADIKERGRIVPIVARTIELAIRSCFVHVETLHMPLAAINRKSPCEPILAFRRT